MTVVEEELQTCEMCDEEYHEDDMIAKHNHNGFEATEEVLFVVCMPCDDSYRKYGC